MRKLAVIISVVILPIFLLCNCGGGNYNWVASQKEREMNDASYFLSIGKTELESVGLLSNECVFRGSISNSAQYTTYSDIVLKLSHYSKNEVLLASENVVLDLSLNPGETKPFSFRYKDKFKYRFYEIKVTNCSKKQY